MKKSVIIILSTSLTAIYLLSIFLFFYFDKISPAIVYVAHRGYSTECLENSKEAFTRAAELSFYGIETDVMPTADGQIVCNHDETVTTEGGLTLKVAESTLAQLRAEKITKNGYTDYIATLDDYLAACAEGGKTAVIELKATFTDEGLKQLLAAAHSYLPNEKIEIIAFDIDQLVRCRKLDKTVTYYGLANNEEAVEKTYANGFNLDVKYRTLSKAMVRRFHSAGLKVNVWTVNSRLILSYCSNLGVDVITSDVYYEA